MNNSDKLKLAAGLIGASIIMGREAPQVAAPQKTKRVKPVWERDSVKYYSPRPYDPKEDPGRNERMGWREDYKYLPDIPKKFIELYIYGVFLIKLAPSQIERSLNLDTIRKVYNEMKASEPLPEKRKWYQKKIKEVPPIEEPIDPPEVISEEFMIKFYTRLEEIEKERLDASQAAYAPRRQAETLNAIAWSNSAKFMEYKTIISVNNSLWIREARLKAEKEWIAKNGIPLPEVHIESIVKDLIENVCISFIADCIRALNDIGYSGKKLLKPAEMDKLINNDQEAYLRGTYRAWQAANWDRENPLA